jgi:hypothetical protein
MLKLIILLLIATPCYAADPWTREDTYREAAYLTLLAADWAQTRSFRRAGHSEANALLGERPSQSRVDSIILLTGIAHVGIVHALPSNWRDSFQIVSIGLEIFAVQHNVSVGIKARF